LPREARQPQREIPSSIGVITVERTREITGKGTILVVSAGTSAFPWRRRRF